MLHNLFKPDWKSPNVEKRLKAISDMKSATGADDQEILLQLATDDAEVTVRVAAVTLLVSIDALHRQSLKDQDATVRAEAEKRVNELLTANPGLNEKQYRDLLNSYPELQRRIATFADSPLVRIEAISLLEDAQLLEVLSGTVYTDSRQLIAERLIGIEALETARKALRGKDKNAERIIKSKIDTIRRFEKQEAENLTEVEGLIDEAEYLANHDWLPEFQQRCRAHRQHWDTLAFAIDEKYRARFEAARSIVDSRYDHQLEIEQTRQSQTQLINEFEAALKVVAGNGLTTSIEVWPEVQSQLNLFKVTWHDLAEINPPDDELDSRYQSLQKTLSSAVKLVNASTGLIQDLEADQEVNPEDDNEEPSNQDIDSAELSKKIQQLKAALANLEWPGKYGELKLATELQQQLGTWKQQQQASVEAHKKKLDSVHKNINSLFRFSRAGNLGRAKQTTVKVEKALAQFSGKDQAALQARFDDAKKTMSEISDWKNFATEPKYIELCEAMELLGSSTQHPDKRSNAMKALQQQWKELGHSDISEQYWPRFKTAADVVYKPCAEFFEQRRENREANTKQREKFVEQMQQLLENTDWDDSPDYQTLQSSVRSIMDSFTRIKDVERNAGQIQWKRLSKCKDAVMAKLDIAYDTNIEMKHQLIGQTVTLAEADAKIQNLDTLKMLQSRWKQVGITRRNQDQKAWREFKEQGDIVYNKVQELRQGLRNETDQQLNAYRAIIKEIQQLAKTASNMAEADQQFSKLQTSYAELPELPTQLPEKLVDGIRRDYGKACDQYQDSHSRMIRSRRNQEIESLRLKADLCVRLEALSSSVSDAELEEISQQWNSITLSSNDLSRRIEARRSAAQSDLNRVELSAERRLLCIQLEIALEVDSPAEDKAHRMQYQLEQMNQSGFGSQTVNSKETLKNMELDWLCMPGAEPELQIVLDKRFQQTLRTGRK